MKLRQSFLSIHIKWFVKICPKFVQRHGSKHSFSEVEDEESSWPPLYSSSFVVHTHFTFVLLFWIVPRKEQLEQNFFPWKRKCSKGLCRSILTTRNMTSLENRNSSALFKRAEQLKRWSESDTNTQPSEPKRKSQRIQFTDGCVFLAACAASDKEEVDRLLKRGADIDTANIDGLTALHQVSSDFQKLVWVFHRRSLCDRWSGIHNIYIYQWNGLVENNECVDFLCDFFKRRIRS